MEMIILPIIAWVTSVLLMPIIFWPLLLLLCWSLCVATEHESYGSTFFAATFGTALGILKFGSFTAAWAAILGNPLLVVGALVGYFIIGTIWSRFKWGLYVSDKAAEINEHIRMHGTEITINNFKSRINGEWNDKEIRETSFACLAPQVGDFKGKIVSWIILWIPSFAWFLLNDPLRRIGNWIFENIKGNFQAVSDAAFKKSFKVITPKEEPIDLEEVVK